MNKSEIFAFLNSHPLCHLATLDEKDQPRVRGMYMYRADENGLIFHTGSKKDLCRQLQAHPKVELCFNDLKDNTQVRVTGTVEQVDDLELKKEIVACREFMKPWVEQHGYEVLAVFRIRNNVATVWRMEDNFAPKTHIPL